MCVYRTLCNVFSLGRNATWMRICKVLQHVLRGFEINNIHTQTHTNNNLQFSPPSFHRAAAARRTPAGLALDLFEQHQGTHILQVHNYENVYNMSAHMRT